MWGKSYKRVYRNLERSFSKSVLYNMSNVSYLNVAMHFVFSVTTTYEDETRIRPVILVIRLANIFNVL